jgi:DNA primase
MTRNGKNLKDAKHKSIFVSEVAAILSSMENEIEIQSYAGKVSDETGIDIKTILEEIQKIKKAKNPIENNNRNNRNNNISGNIYNLEPAYKKAERGLIQLAISNEDYLKYIRNKISLEEFITDSYKIAGEYIFSKLDCKEEITPSDILVKFQDPQDINDIALIFEVEENTQDSYKIIDDFVKTIKRVNIENKINELTIRIRKYEENSEVVESAILSQTLIRLQKQLNLL